VKKLFLDDIRLPPDDTWDVVRSYDEFVAYIEANGMPDVISFDHDLGFTFWDEVCFEKSGYDCAKWLVKKGLRLRQWFVHSMNPVGRENIHALLTHWHVVCSQKEANASRVQS